MPSGFDHFGSVDEAEQENAFASVGYRGRTWNPIAAALGEDASVEDFCAKIGLYRQKVSQYPRVGEQTLVILKDWNSRLSAAGLQSKQQLACIEPDSNSEPNSIPPCNLKKESTHSEEPEVENDSLEGTEGDAPLQGHGNEIRKSEEDETISATASTPDQLMRGLEETVAAKVPEGHVRTQSSRKQSPEKNNTGAMADHKSPRSPTSPEKKLSVGAKATKATTIDHKARLTAFYEKYAADKVSQVDTFLEKYKGKEEAMWRVLVKKYGPEP